MDDKWIDSIRDKMADYDVVPPPGLLDAIEAKVRARKMRNRRIFGAVAASVALIGVVSVALIPYMPDTVSGPLMSDVAGEDKGTVFAEQIAVNKAALMSREANPKSETVKLPEIKHIPSEKQEIATEHPQMDPEPYIPSKRIEDDSNSDEAVYVVEIIDSNSKEHSPLSVGVSASANGLGGMLNDGNIEGRPLLASGAMPLTRMGGGILGESNSNSSPAPTYVELFDHRLPIRASIDFSLPVWHGLSVGTGLTYSYLKSDIRYGYSDSPLFKASQCLHFIGIPVNVRYTPWSFRKLGVYVSAGFMAEKCIAGQIKETDPQYPVYRYDGCDSRPFQFSFYAAAGVQYSLVSSCAIFIEPGIDFHLKNGSSLRTIYSERPVTFNVNVGLRFGH